MTTCFLTSCLTLVLAGVAAAADKPITLEQRQQIQEFVEKRSARIDQLAKNCQTKQPTDPANPEKPEGARCKDLPEIKRKFATVVSSYEKLLVRVDQCKSAKRDSMCIAHQATLSELESGWISEMAKEQAPSTKSR